MKEIRGDIFAQYDADAICVTTNGVVKKNGELVMGRGIAQQFAERYPCLAQYLGEQVTRNGNHVCLGGVVAGRGDKVALSILSFPTKEHWRDPSPMWLIERSAKELVAFADRNSNTIQKIVLPRPGCGLGGLKWEDVKKVIEPILDDRFYIITP